MHASIGTFAVVSLMISQSISPLLEKISHASHPHLNATLEAGAVAAGPTSDQLEELITHVVALSFLIGMINVRGSLSLT